MAENSIGVWSYFSLYLIGKFIFCHPFCNGGLIRGVASVEEVYSVVFYYLSASEIWPDKRGFLWWGWLYKRTIVF
jgi:hypothetical protein